MEREKKWRSLRLRGFILTLSLIFQLVFGICREILYWEDPRTVRTNVDNIISIVALAHAIIISQEKGGNASVTKFRTECTYWTLIVWLPVLILSICCASLNIYYDLHSLSEYNIAMMTLEWFSIFFFIFQPSAEKKGNAQDTMSICSATEIKVDQGIENLGTWF
ncbi:Oidioi.mRNA.OKI2018_I69.XSR.g14887.t1.cds [Oikopleura dioica]|uniref:Oidioi.mRNA.OKI2018_I69.XSR.g14887.t1.cds n=1 Tax=Oikopleura dioica TaxID=34765 RepID=A0ABN7SCW2_OIKDI|nr:Oidioi.mRNA.OKI2018_I69.XSR.g14887.t1.cds [Oikopleura dioica]